MDVMAIDPPAALQSWLVFIGVAATAAGAVFGVSGWIVRRAVVPALRHEIAAQVKPLHEVVTRELGVNGREGEGDPQDRGQPMRVLLLRTAARARRVDHEVDEQREQLEAHEREHIRREADWPAFADRRMG